MQRIDELMDIAQLLVQCVLRSDYLFIAWVIYIISLVHWSNNTNMLTWHFSVHVFTYYLHIDCMVAAFGQFGTDKQPLWTIPCYPCYSTFLLCVLSVLEHTSSFVNTFFRVICDGEYGFLFLLSQTIIIRNLEQLILLLWLPRHYLCSFGTSDFFLYKDSFLFICDIFLFCFLTTSNNLSSMSEF